MIFTIKKDDCYKISGTLILNNKYTKIEGKTYSSGYTQKTLGNDYAQPTSEVESSFVHNEYSSWTIGKYYTKFALRYYIKEYDLGSLTSSTIMDLNVSSFSTKVTYDGGTKDARVFTNPQLPMPTGNNPIAWSPTSGFDLDDSNEIPHQEATSVI